MYTYILIYDDDRAVLTGDQLLIFIIMNFNCFSNTPRVYGTCDKKHKTYNIL